VGLLPLDGGQEAQGCGVKDDSDFTPLGCAGLLALLVVATMIDAFATMKLWGWYVVPVFGVKPIGMLASFGLSYFMGAILPRRESLESTKIARETDRVIRHLVGTGYILLFGWAAHAIWGPL
jgi:hypothetical protein